MLFLSVGGSGSEDHASHANLQDFEAGSSLDRPQSVRLHTETVLPAGQHNLKLVSKKTIIAIQKFTFRIPPGLVQVCTKSSESWIQFVGRAVKTK